MCWACGKPAKGQKHFKENPECLDEKRSLLPQEVTTEMIQQFLGLQDDPTVNIRQCAFCPHCAEVNQKRGTKNALTCKKCSREFCYICNKPITSASHYKGTSQCHENSEPHMDF